MFYTDFSFEDWRDSFYTGGEPEDYDTPHYDDDEEEEGDEEE